MIGELGEALGGIRACRGRFGGIRGWHYGYIQELKEIGRK